MDDIKEKKRRHLIPKDYISAVADRLHSINPSRDIVSNTVKDVWCDGYARGYMARIDDHAHFARKREQRLKESFDTIKDMIDDEIHTKNN